MVYKNQDPNIQEFVKFSVPKNSSLYVLHSLSDRVKLGRSKKLFDYITLVDILGNEHDIQSLLSTIYDHLNPNGRIIIIYRNYFYSFFKELISSSKKDSPNWLSTNDIKTFLHLSGFTIINQQPLLFIPTHFSTIDILFNRLLLYFFPLNHLSYLQYITGYKSNTLPKDQTVSIIIPARNEKGNIEKLFNTLPLLGPQTQAVFIEGHSHDGTKEEIERCIKKYSKISPFSFILLNQTGSGKADAVSMGIKSATGNIIIIYDADMTVHPDDLIKFYLAIINNRGDFINGSRLIYPIEKNAMQSLNILGNKLFSLVYSWILGQTIKDTLCGTKAFWKKDYNRIVNEIEFFGKFDPFGDFDLLLGAGKMNLKIIDLPVRYYSRTYGSTNIQRFKNAWELMRLSLFGIKKLKMRL